MSSANKRPALPVLTPFYVAVGLTDRTVQALRDLGSKEGRPAASPVGDLVDVVRGAVSVPAFAVGEAKAAIDRTQAEVDRLAERGQETVRVVTSPSRLLRGRSAGPVEPELAREARAARRVARQAEGTVARAGSTLRQMREEAGNVVDAVTHPGRIPAPSRASARTGAEARPSSPAPQRRVARVQKPTEAAPPSARSEPEAAPARKPTEVAPPSATPERASAPAEQPSSDPGPSQAEPISSTSADTPADAAAPVRPRRPRRRPAVGDTAVRSITPAGGDTSNDAPAASAGVEAGSTATPTVRNAPANKAAPEPAPKTAAKAAATTSPTGTTTVTEKKAAAKKSTAKKSSPRKAAATTTVAKSAAAAEADRSAATPEGEAPSIAEAAAAATEIVPALPDAPEPDGAAFGAPAPASTAPSDQS